MEQYPVVYLDMPTTIHSFVRKTADGYTVVINPRISSTAQKKAYLHEVAHIENADLDSEDRADAIEARRHRSE